MIGLVFLFICFPLKACPDGRYGYNCQEKCNLNCGVSYRCDRATGQCEGGCQIGWKGQTCDTRRKWRIDNFIYNINVSYPT